MIVDLDAMKIFLDTALTDDSQNDEINQILNAVDIWVKEYCHKDFDSTTYTNELYDGTGSTSLFVRNPPIISVTKVAVDREGVIRVRNTSTDASNATVTIDSDSLDLFVAGGDNAHASTELAFSTYTTLALLIAQINATGSGWVAQIIQSRFNSLLSTELLVTDALYCGARASMAAQWEELEVAGEPVSGIRVLRETGEIYYPSGFPSGFLNIPITYTGGYSTANMPSDLKFAVMVGVKALWNKRNMDGFGISDFSVSQLRIKYTEMIPETVAILDNSYKDVVV